MSERGGAEKQEENVEWLIYNFMSSYPLDGKSATCNSVNQNVYPEILKDKMTAELQLKNN